MIVMMIIERNFSRVDAGTIRKSAPFFLSVRNPYVRVVNRLKRKTQSMNMPALDARSGVLRCWNRVKLQDT